MDKPDAMGDLPMTDMANATDSPDTMDIILNSIMGLDARKKLRERAIARRNIPCVEEHIAPPNREEIIKLSAERLLIGKLRINRSNYLHDTLYLKKFHNRPAANLI